MKTIKKTITLKIDEEEGKLICYDTTTIQLVMGSKSVVGNYRMYKIDRDGNKFIVKKDIVKKRLQELKSRRIELDNKIDIMEQVLK